MKKLRKDNKGFTLVELIVVLVILAILAAILVPALLGYIDEARQKQMVLHGKSVHTAAQSVATQYYAKGTAPVDDKTNFAAKVSEIADLDEFGVKGVKAEITFTKSGSHSGYVIETIAYGETEDSKTEWIELVNGSWESVSGTPTTGDVTVEWGTNP